MRRTGQLRRLPPVLAVAVLAAALVAAAPSRAAAAGPRQPTLRQEAAEVGLHVGSAVSDSALTGDPTYAAILGRQFSALTPENEMKWGPIEPQQGVYDFAPADDEVRFAERHGMRVRGHNLVWYNQLPTWLTAGSFSDAQLADLLRRHILAEAGHFRGRIWQWDVVNEPLNGDGSLHPSVWLTALGPDYIADALRWAHQADPSARLFLNDYGIEGIGPKSDAMYALVRSLRASGVPIGGVGFETHLTLDGGLPATFQQNLQRFADLGVDVDVTEMDVRIDLPVQPGNLQTQAQVYADALRACLAVRRCVDFTVWEYTDKYSWVPGFFRNPPQGAADVYDENLQPKPAYAALLAALEQPGQPRLPEAA